MNGIIDRGVELTNRLFTIPVWVLVHILPISKKDAMDIISISFMYASMLYGV
jgi:hypothetical protein